MLKGTLILTFSHREKGLLAKARRFRPPRGNNGGLESAVPWDKKGLLGKERQSPVRRGSDDDVPSGDLPGKLPLPEGEGWGEGQSGAHRWSTSPRRRMRRKGPLILTFSHREKGLPTQARRFRVPRLNNGGLESAAPWDKKGMLAKERQSPVRGGDDDLESAAWELPLPEGEGWGEGQSSWRSCSKGLRTTLSVARIR